MNSIPKLNHSVYKTKLPILQKNIVFRPFTVAEEKALLLSTQGEPLDQFLQLETLIKDCVKSGMTDVEFDNLSIYDFLFLMNKIKGKSVGENTSLRVTCSNCNSDFETDISIEKSLHIQKSDQPTKFKLDGNKFYLILKYPNYKTLQEIFRFSNKKDIETEITQQPPEEKETDVEKEANYTLSWIYNSIEKIIVESQEYNNFTLEEFEENVFNQMMSNTVNELVEVINTLGNLHIEANFNCPHCDHINTYKEDNILAFFL